MHPISAGTAFKRPSFEALQREAAQLGAQIKLVRGFRLLGAWEADTGTVYIYARVWRVWSAPACSPMN